MVDSLTMYMYNSWMDSSGLPLNSDRVTLLLLDSCTHKHTSGHKTLAYHPDLSIKSDRGGGIEETVPCSCSLSSGAAMRRQSRTCRRASGSTRGDCTICCRGGRQREGRAPPPLAPRLRGSHHPFTASRLPCRHQTGPHL